jgi:hypothetical protein
MSAMQDFVRRLFGDTPKGCCGVKFETVDSQPEAAADRAAPLAPSAELRDAPPLTGNRSHET